MSEDASESLEKAVWTHADFDDMGWHDATVHAIGFEEVGDRALLMLDLDYIVRWIDPQPPHEYFTFFVAPATLVFENVSHFVGDMEPYGAQLLIDGVDRLEPEADGQRPAGLCPWHIDGHDFDMTFIASGFRQHFRARPLHTRYQTLSADERGEISFAQPTHFPTRSAFAQ
jgi:hypothetical protein